MYGIPNMVISAIAMVSDTSNIPPNDMDKLNQACILRPYSALA